MWTTRIDNPEILKGIYGKYEVTFEDTQLMEMHFTQSSSMIINISSKTLPLHPPKKWLAQKFSRVSLEVYIVLGDSVRIENWLAGDIVDFKISGLRPEMSFSLIGDGVTIIGHTLGVRLNKITPYLTWDDEPLA